jgi:hypothetical protein
MLPDSALLAVERARAAMKAERAADIEELERWFATEIALIRAEIFEARRELAIAKKQLLAERDDHASPVH